MSGEHLTLVWRWIWRRTLKIELITLLILTFAIHFQHTAGRGIEMTFAAFILLPLTVFPCLLTASMFGLLLTQHPGKLAPLYGFDQFLADLHEPIQNLTKLKTYKYVRNMILVILLLTTSRAITDADVFGKALYLYLGWVGIRTFYTMIISGILYFLWQMIDLNSLVETLLGGKKKKRDRSDSVRADWNKRLALDVDLSDIPQDESASGSQLTIKQ